MHVIHCTHHYARFGLSFLLALNLPAIISIGCIMNNTMTVTSSDITASDTNFANNYQPQAEQVNACTEVMVTLYNKVHKMNLH